jgi:YHS domain-containing protein/copper chaperone CopZ
MQSITARGEAFKIPQVLGNLFVCAEENGGCCCGHAEKGRAVVDKALYDELWQSRRLRNKVHLTFVGCLGPCPVGNVAMLLIHGRSIWFKDLNDNALLPLLFDYIAAIVATGAVTPLTGALAEHVFERYATPTVIDFDGIDPVCMMAVDPATAEWRSDFEDKTYCFCAPSCKRAFDKDPAAYVRPNSATASAPVIAAPADIVLIDVAPRDSKSFVVPNISCEHCVRSITNELRLLDGVTVVQADHATKRVAVEWTAPATWAQIEATLAEIDYPPQSPE